MEKRLAKERILIVDDEKNIVSSLTGILSDEGYDVSMTGDGVEALELIQKDPPDLVLLDIWLPGMDGIEVLKTLKTYNPGVEVLIMSGHGTIDTAVKATKLGAQDFIEKPFSLDRITESIQNALHEKKSVLTKETGSPAVLKQLPVCFESMVEVKKGIKALSEDLKPVLLLGETGTGKESVARAIHAQSLKADLPFVKLNCSFRQKQAIQTQLFKRKNKENKPGSDSASGKKVVLLSNIESLSKGLQEKLAEALQNASHPGSSFEFLPSRLFISSAENLEDLAAKGKFHQGLLDCFKETTLLIPPLRNHAASISVITRDFWEEKKRELNTILPKIEEGVLTALCSYSWPGNIKELRNVLEKLILTCANQETIRIQDLPPEIWKPQNQIDINSFNEVGSLQEAETIWEKHFILHHLKRNNWDIDKTCKVLKTTKKQFQEKIKFHSIEMQEVDSSSTQKKYPQRTLKRSVVLCGSSLHSGIKTGLILQPMPPGSGIIFGDIASGKTIPAQLENVQSTDYSTCLKRGANSVGTIEHIMATLHMYRVTNLLIKIGDEAPVMDGSAKDFCELLEDGEFEDQDDFYEEIVVDKCYSFGDKEKGGPYISIEPSDNFSVSYHMEYPEPIGIQDFTYEFQGDESFKKEIAPARTFGFMEEVAQLTKMGYASGGKLDNFILLGDNKVLNTELRFEDEFARHKILDILGDFYLLGKPIRGKIKACKSGHTQNVGLLKIIRDSLTEIN
ncbi:MAG: UDP-3-O-[3-hydroxymyristoyl] N-acetylglucosamine deacetylase [Nitrospinae bacterium]|nr:UDP-3-O-[3-hydroxymyristoyl] N-acetylglucosamine deacetylase [Nitrospinota bacterium]MZH13286.1 UDP-3-O-[3-hydroxymyristoyl] N-acetylglucosamine deacetylase [Nitrospinota bacterium]